MRRLFSLLTALLLIGSFFAAAPVAAADPSPVVVPQAPVPPLVPNGPVRLPSGKVLPMAPAGALGSVETSVQAQMLAQHANDRISFAPGAMPQPRVGGDAAVTTGTARVDPSVSLLGLADPSSPPTATYAALPNGLRKEVFGFLPYWMLDPGQLQWMQYQLVSTIAYFSVGANSDGTLQPGTGWNGWNSAAMTGVINSAHARGGRVVLTVTMMAWDGGAAQGVLLGNATYRARLAANIVSAVGSRNADGVNLDFEPVYTAQRDQFTSFVRQVKAALVANRVGSYVTVDTMAGAATWASGYDLVGLTAAGAADAVFVMGYDFSWSGSSRAGGVAPMTSPYMLDVNQAVGDYLSVIPGNKIIWGVPYYGRTWQTTSSALNAAVRPGSASASVAYYYVGSLSQARQYGRRWDAVGQVPWYVYYDNARGTWVEGYYDDTASLGVKWDMVNQRGLAGTGMWTLLMDQGTTELWNLIANKFVTNYRPLPTAAFQFPAVGATTTTGNSTNTITWSESANGGTITARRLTEQYGRAVNPGSCLGVDWVTAWSGNYASPLTTGGFTSGWCYRYTLDLTDGAGFVGSTSSGTLLINGPSATFSSPAAGTTVTSTNSTNTVTWTETTAGAPISARTLTERYGQAVTPGTCAGVSWQVAWSIAATSPFTTGGFTPGYCYQYSISLTATDGLTGGADSGNLFVGGGAPPTASFTSPGAGTLLTTTNSTNTITWNESSGTAPLFARTLTEQYGRVVSAGSCSGVQWLTAWSANFTSPFTTGGFTANYCYRFTLTLTNLAGLSSAASSGELLVQGPTATFTSPAAGSLVTSAASTNTITWAESTSGGPIAARTLTEFYAQVVTPGTCAGVTWQVAWSGSYSSPFTTGGFTPGYCYRYTITLANATGLSSSAGSGELLIHVPGIAAQTNFAPPRPVWFAAGSHTGYRFDSAGRVTGTLTYDLPRSSWASAGARAIINDLPYLAIVNGIWAGYWIPETPRSRMP